MKKEPVVFEKMHGIGNDFVLIDNRKINILFTKGKVSSLANRHTGIGFDQLLVIDDSEFEECDAAYRFFNPDGSEAEQCGNGQRCLSKYLHMKNPKQSEFCLSGLSGNIYSTVHSDGTVTVNMGQVNDIEDITIANQVCYQVDFGNPHLVTLVDSVSDSNLSQLNTKFCQEFINDINFEIVDIISASEIKIRVHERGTGETLACGSGACASVAALLRAGKISNKVKVMLPGGNLVVEYNQQNKNICLSGAAQHVFTGKINL